MRILRENALCSIATIGTGNVPHINAAYFAFSTELAIYFLSHPASLHSRNLLKSSRAALSVFSTAQAWDGPDRGVQLFGHANELAGREQIEAQRIYRRRFKGYSGWIEEQSNAVGRQYRLYRFNASKVKILDEREFGDGVFVTARVN